MTDIERIKEALDTGKLLKAYYLLKEKLSDGIYEEGYKVLSNEEMNKIGEGVCPSDLESV